MDDVDRLFRHLVEVLASESPERLRAPFQISELYQSLIPYRAHKRALRFDSIGDYEMAILRLLAGARGYASVDPPDVQEALSLEAESLNPSPGSFRDYAAATVVLNGRAVRSILDEEAAYAPPGYPPPVGEVAEEGEGTEGAKMAEDEATAPQLVFEAVEAAPSCPHCDAGLPARRRVVFCPHCGWKVEEVRCQQCGEPLEAAWRFCITCGKSVTK
ncbi:MAG: hypothetical protein GTN62_06160 [Gemmatimonadales bacterium]|nr:hypothetical protein [Gemmatimonadales bacterium]NIN11082.1 hypothetical protein [Gemmatimonadales bacterium]NIN49679.1 hypothetical protein [Gemmatimonadales bacterium]NIP07143.1 hypothetical protein [Gemmatimonadales bacterium]NIQ99534.1 hypothetical protein [Gemmatimonadales bacterium]